MTDEKVDRVTKLSIHDRPNVTMVGEGVENGRDVLVVSVEPGSGLTEADFPETVGGLPVVVEESEPPTPSVSNRNTHRPLESGISVSNYGAVTDGKGSVGTIGPVLTDGSEHYISTNWHVFFTRGGQVGDGVIQPGFGDTGSEYRFIGSVAGAGPIEGESEVDMAWASVRDGVEISRRVHGVGVPGSVRSPSVGDKVVMSGRTSGVTRGEVLQTGVVSRTNIGTFVDQVKVTDISDVGDSGSAVLHDDSTLDYAGVINAGASDYSMMNDIANWHGTNGMRVVEKETGDPDNGSDSCTYKGEPRTAYNYCGSTDNLLLFQEWQKCNLSTSEFASRTPRGEGTNQLTTGSCPPSGGGDGTSPISEPGDGDTMGAIAVAAGFGLALMASRDE